MREEPSRSGRRSVLAAAVALVAASLLGCGGGVSPSPSPTATATTGVYGITLLNQEGSRMNPPPTPQPLPGGFGTSSAAPYPRGDILIQKADGQGGRQTVAKVQSNAQGLFRIELRAATS